MTEDIRIFSYLPNPRVWKSLITAKLAKVEIKVIGDKPRNLPEWLWDFDAKKIDEIDSEELEKYKRQSKRGFKGDLFKTDEFLEPFLQALILTGQWEFSNQIVSCVQWLELLMIINFMEGQIN